MRKIMAILMTMLLLVGLLPLGAVAAEETIATTWITTTPTGEDTLSVKVATQVANAWLAVAFTDDTGEFLDFYQGRTSGVTDTVTYKLDRGNLSSTYYAQVSVSNASGALLNQKLSVAYYSYDEQMLAITAILGAADVQNAVETQADCLGFDIQAGSRYSALGNKAAVAATIQQALVAETSPTPVDAQEIFADVVNLAYLNQADTQIMQQLISTNDFLQVDKSTDEYAWYEGNMSCILPLLTEKTYTDISLFNNIFQSTSYLYKLSREHILNLENLLRNYNSRYEENGSTITLDFTEFDTRLTTKAKKDYALDQLDGILYDSVSALSDAFDAAIVAGAVYEAPIVQDGGSDNSSSFGGGGGSGMGFLVGEKDKTKDEEVDNRLFVDIDHVSWAREGIEYFGGKGIISGKSPQRFCPDDSITREEFVKILVMVFNIPNSETELSFEDVCEDTWYYDYVMRGASNGIVQGQGTRFGVGENISREDMAVLLYRMAQKLNLNQTESEKEQPADYETIAEYAKLPVLSMYRSGIINGMTATEFAPKNHATRAQAVKLIYELYIRAGLV